MRRDTTRHPNKTDANTDRPTRGRCLHGTQPARNLPPASSAPLHEHDEVTNRLHNSGMRTAQTHLTSPLTAPRDVPGHDLLQLGLRQLEEYLHRIYIEDPRLPNGPLQRLLVRGRRTQAIPPPMAPSLPRSHRAQRPLRAVWRSINAGNGCTHKLPSTPARVIASSHMNMKRSRSSRLPTCGGQMPQHFLKSNMHEQLQT